MSPDQAIAVMIFTAVALVWDVKSRRIPNGLNLVGLILGLAFQTYHRGWDGLLFSLAGFGTGFGILFILWIIGGGGGGDVKLMGAVGAWLGPYLTLIVFVASGFLAAFGQVVMTAANRGRKEKEAGLGGPLGLRESDSLRAASEPVDAELEDELQRQHATELSNRRKVPYAVPVAIAVWVICGLKLIQFYSGV